MPVVGAARRPGWSDEVGVGRQVAVLLCCVVVQFRRVTIDTVSAALDQSHKSVRLLHERADDDTLGILPIGCHCVQQTAGVAR